jgi:transcriptional regulator with XRE-family HTH domain
MTTERLGDRLRTQRLACGFSQSDLAQLIGTNKHAISRYENHRNTPSLPTLRRLADALAVTIGWLTEGIEV